MAQHIANSDCFQDLQDKIKRLRVMAAAEG
jgi:hypothetical protein